MESLQPTRIIAHSEHAHTQSPRPVDHLKKPSRAEPCRIIRQSVPQAAIFPHLGRSPQSRTLSLSLSVSLAAVFRCSQYSTAIFFCLIRFRGPPLVALDLCHIRRKHSKTFSPPPSPVPSDDFLRATSYIYIYIRFIQISWTCSSPYLFYPAAVVINLSLYLRVYSRTNRRCPKGNELLTRING